MSSNLDPYIILPKVPILDNRQTVILDKCRAKRVLHLGCVDAGLLQERFDRKELMHQKLQVIAGELWGLDVDADGIEFLKSKGFEKLLVGDVSQLDKIELLHGVEFDIIVASEVVEHLQNPGLFLQSVQALMKPNHTSLIISVPNAFRIDTLLWLLKGIEYVHPDHNYWFSYLTITNLLKKNNLEVINLYVYSLGKKNILPQKLSRLFKQADISQGTSWDDRILLSNNSGSYSFLQGLGPYLKSLAGRVLAKYLYSRSPFWGDGLIVEAKIVK